MTGAEISAIRDVERYLIDTLRKCRRASDRPELANRLRQAGRALLALAARMDGGS